MSDNFLMHVGTPHDGSVPHSGRYQWGTGENPNQHMENKPLSEQVRALKQAHPEYSMTQIAQILGYKSTTALRAEVSRQKAEKMQADSKKVLELYSKGVTSPTQIARELNMTESNVRTIIKRQGVPSRYERNENVKQQLRDLVKNDKYIDVGSGSELALGVTEVKKKQLLMELEAEGYQLKKIYIDQLGTGYKTTLEVLCAPDVTDEELRQHKADIKPIDRYIEEPDGSRSILGLPPVNSIDSSRVSIRYAEEGGIDKDGVIEIRRGVEELSLGNAHYAQVRIGVDGTHYLKGMAVYGDDKDFPPGTDIIFNTNKHIGTDKMDVLKEMKKLKGSDEVDQDNPFGASVKRESELKLAQRYYIDPVTGEKKVSAINVVNEEGDWEKWSKNLSSQFLSKQPLPLIKQQLHMAYLQKADEFSDIQGIQNDSVKKVLLMNFADKCDSAAVDLKAAALPRQQTHVLLPLTTLKDGQIYAPNYQNGEEVILVRHPHAGPFEIPRLVVNNNNKEGKSIMGSNPVDAVGITAKAAAQLSGADYDGDTALVIPLRTSTGPNSKINNIKTEKAIKDLQEFDPKAAYPAYDGMTKVKEDTRWNKQRQMGSVSNLITDMTLMGAPTEDIIKAVRHSMVIIDAEKHNLDWRKSEVDNDIKALKKRYQGKETGGAKTIISRASAEYRIDQESLRFEIDPATGKKTNFKTGTMEAERKMHRDAEGNKVYENTGKMKLKQQKSTRMREVDDAYDLVSDRNNPYPKEVPYANYANQMKQMANDARKLYISLNTSKKDPAAASIYADEVKSLDAKLDAALRNAPRERQAQLRANDNYRKKKKERDDFEPEDIKKLKNQCLAEARAACGAKSQKVTITPKEWEAIENRAVSGTKVEKLISKADTAQVMKYAIPRDGAKLSTAKVNRIKAMGRQGQSTADIAEALGISTATVQKYLSSSN